MGTTKIKGMLVITRLPMAANHHGNLPEISRGAAIEITTIKDSGRQLKVTEEVHIEMKLDEIVLVQTTTKTKSIVVMELITMTLIVVIAIIARIIIIGIMNTIITGTIETTDLTLISVNAQGMKYNMLCVK